MNMERLFRSVTAVLAGLTLTIGAASAAMAQNDQVSLGVVVPLTGTNAVQGQDIERGIELAAKRINAGYAVPMKGDKTQHIGPGLLGKRVNLIVQDNESRPASAMDAVHKLVDVNKVPMVLGIYSSGIAVPTGQFTDQNHVIEIASASTSPQLRSIGPYFFDMMGLDNLMGKALADFAYTDTGRAKRFASIVPNNPFGVGMEIEACKELVRLGGECVTKVRYEQGKSDYRPELNRLTSQHPDAVFFTAYGTDSRLILEQAYQLGISFPKGWYADYPTMWSNEVKSEPQVAQGIKGLRVGPSGDFYQKEYAAAYKQAYDEEPTTAFGAFGYDAMMVAALAIDKAGTTDPDAVRKALVEVSRDYRGVTGDKAFDAEGMQVTEDYQHVIYQDGSLVPYHGAK